MPALAIPSNDKGTLLALLVDRDPDTRHMYAEFLRQAACDTDEAEDGREALAKALTRHPDVIVTETRLSGINGFDLCRLLRDDAATRDIRIVFVTGDGYEQDIKRARSVGADAVLVKPCLPEHLGKEIERLFAKSREIRDRMSNLQQRIANHVAESESVVLNVKRVMLSRAHQRRYTTDPPTAPPAVVCPSCDQPLKYTRSHVGGVSARHPEQWDYYECQGGCGTFQYRQRTRKLRRV